MKRLPWRSNLETGEEGTTQRSISQRDKFTQKPGCMVGFFAVFLLAGLGFLMIFAIPGWKVVAARGWAPVDCEILSSSVGSHSSSDGGPTYSIDVRYRYRFADPRNTAPEAGRTVEYTSDRYDFLGGSSSGYDGKKEVVDRLSPGTITTCYVDPDDPSEAVLYRGLSWIYLFALLPLVFVAIGGGGMLWALTSMRGKAAKAAAGGFDEEMGAFREVDSWSTPVVPSGPIELEESLSPGGKLGCLIGVCILWNGIVSIFVWQVWSQWRAGGGVDGCLAVFLIPFVLVGLAILVGIPYQILALANPRPRLTLSRAGVPLGESGQLGWSFRGSTGRLQDLRIWLEGSEEARYRRGTTTHTDTEVFAEIDVVRIDGGMPLASGNATIEIPVDTMHSFEASHNKIVWKLKLTSSIAWWPDVITEFDFVVVPRGGEG